MRSRHVAAALTLAVLMALSGTILMAQEAKVPVKEVTLTNGMKLLLVERHHAPTVAAGWIAHVGSANESYGVTGIAHLFEHMMFKGTQTIGTTDFAREAEIMAELDEIRGQMEQEYSALRVAKRRGEVSGSIYLPENQTPRLGELRAKMKTLQDEQRKLLVKEEYETIYTTRGASGINAGTNEDATIYFLTVPANKLELWFWMESDRLLNPVFREFYSERDVVREERRMRVESDPTARFEEQFDAMFWGSVPYHHPVIGWPSDVESINREQAESFFATHYAPNNLTAALVGDFDTDEVMRLARKYLERIPRGRVTPPEVVTEEIEQIQEKRMAAEAETNPSTHIRWHAVPFVHKDAYALDVLDGVLRGRTGRLYKALVEDKEIATGEPYSSFGPKHFAGSFEIGAEIADGHDHQEVEAALLAVIDRIKNEPVSDRELQKVKNQSLANSFRRLQSNFFLMLQLLFYDVLGDWQYLNESPAKIQAVTADDLMRVARTYLTPEGKNVLRYHRKAGTSEDPEVAALTGQARAFAKQVLAQLASAEDIAELEQGLAQMQGGLAQAPPEVKPALELIIRRTQERIEQLRSAAGEEE